MFLWQLGFTYNARRAYAKHLERIQKFQEADDWKHIYKNKLDKFCFDCDAASSNSKDLAKRNVLCKILQYRAYDNVLNSKYDGYQRGFASMVYKEI